MKGEIIAVRGGGDLASGTIWTLHKSGFRVVVSEIEQPTAIRRTVSFCEAMYDGTAEVEGVTSKKIKDISDAEKVWNEDMVPIIEDPALEKALSLKPFALVDAAIAKRNLGTSISMAPLVAALGPGFTAGEDADVVIETKRGHNLGRLIYSGSAAPNSGVPGMIAGYGRERVMHSENAGIFKNIAKIGDVVSKGDIIAYTGSAPVRASLDGVLRGLLRDGLEIPSGFKVADIDPRINERNNCFTISDKSRAIAGGVLTAVCIYKAGKKI